MLCQDLMKKDVKCIAPTDSVQQAAKLMRDSNVGFLPVCDNNKKAIGTLTDRDIAIRVVADNQNPTSTTVQNVMSRDIISVRPQDDLNRAEELMSENAKSRIIVCSDDGRVAGVISLSDVAQAEGGTQAASTFRNVSGREAPKVH